MSSGALAGPKEGKLTPLGRQGCRQRGVPVRQRRVTASCTACQGRACGPGVTFPLPEDLIHRVQGSRTQRPPLQEWRPENPGTDSGAGRPILHSMPRARQGTEAFSSLAHVQGAPGGHSEKVITIGMVP